MNTLQERHQHNPSHAHSHTPKSVRARNYWQTSSQRERRPKIRKRIDFCWYSGTKNSENGHCACSGPKPVHKIKSRLSEKQSSARRAPERPHCASAPNSMWKSLPEAETKAELRLSSRRCARGIREGKLAQTFYCFLNVNTCKIFVRFAAIPQEFSILKSKWSGSNDKNSSALCCCRYREPLTQDAVRSQVCESETSAILTLGIPGNFHEVSFLDFQTFQITLQSVPCVSCVCFSGTRL